MLIKQLTGADQLADIPTLTGFSIRSIPHVPDLKVTSAQRCNALSANRKANLAEIPRDALSALRTVLGPVQSCTGQTRSQTSCPQSPFPTGHQVFLCLSAGSEK